MGSSVLNLPKNKAILFDGLHYNKINIPYLSLYDSKLKNPSILKLKKNPLKNTQKNSKNILKKREDLLLNNDKKVLKSNKIDNNMEEEKKESETSEEEE